jgi:hypothetical protein
MLTLRENMRFFEKWTHILNWVSYKIAEIRSDNQDRT